MKYRSYKSYPKIIIISDCNNISLNDFIEKLKKIYIIDDKNEWICNNTCVIYNINKIDSVSRLELSNNMSEIEKIIQFAKSLSKTENIKSNKIIIIYKNNEIFTIGNNIITHISTIKQLLKNNKTTMRNLNLDNLHDYTNKYINSILIKNDYEPEITKSRDIGKINNIFYIDKLCIIYNYRNNKKIYCIDNTINTNKKKMLKIIDDNQFIFY